MPGFAGLVAWPPGRWAAAGVAAAILVLGAMSPAAGAEVPESAASASLGLPAVLVDDAPLVFALPSRATEYPAQVMALGASSAGTDNTEGLGGLARAGAQSVWFVSQRAADLSPNGGFGRALQFGSARRVGRLRLGAAIRLADSEQEFSDDRSHASLRDVRVVEGSLGIGFGDSRRHLDLALDLRDLSGEERSTSTRDTSTTRGLVRWESTALPGASLRLGADLGAGKRLVAAASWTEDRIDLFQLVEQDSARSSFMSDLTLPRWSAAIGVTGESEVVGEVTAFAVYRAADIGRFGATGASRDESRYGIAGVAVRHPLPRGLGLLAGVRGEHIRQTSLSSAAGGEVRRLAESASWSDRYTWGVEFERRSLALVAALDAGVEFDQLVLAFDARFRF